MASKKTKKTKERTKPTRKKSNIKELSQNMRIVLATTFLLVFVAVCLIALVKLRTLFSPEPVAMAPVTLVYEESADVVHTLKEYTYSDVFELIDVQLINGPDSTGWRRLQDRNEIQVRQIYGDFPSSHLLAELASHIEQANHVAKLKVSRKQGIIHLYWQDNLTLELKYKVPDVLVSKRGKIAVVMDDMGDSMATLRELLRLNIIITPSILPGTSRALPATTFLQGKGRDYMIHMPMDPRSYPQTNPGANALLLGQSIDETRRLVQSYVASVPGAVGGNNHMGSRYTAETAPMRIVLAELKQQGLFFIDSRTIGDSVAFSEARKMGLKTATRNIFLDNEEDVPYIRKQIRKMVNMASKNREIIAICHPYSETLEAFRLEQEWLSQQPVEFVSASKLVHTY